MDLRQIADRLEIIDLLGRYARAVDSGQWNLLDDVFTPDAVIDYRSASGIRGTRAEVTAWLSEVLSGWPGRLHLIGSVVIRFDGADLEGRDEAAVSAAFTDTLAPSREMVAAGAPGLLRGGGWYHHRMCRTPDGWRSRELVEEQAWRTVTG
ncbi:nuclear transport factor 2 family protein [Nonomuraea sp. 3-1Str]|uniref:nuclear transport factor 2 family protein n=1 Tax=Nonomuraea sp. 3-1Str TaxID=2929801 RepID=UPI00285577B2|nr:nuclear transport factor 2 family protein [Nonomuraea sp. 3-1Str]MDR8412606.1 nuclear transport factor 2 family protein [Nonomuraea sp. 3-1Str]